MLGLFSRLNGIAALPSYYFILLFLGFFSVQAKAIDPLLIDQFMRMSPDQQEAMAKQYGVDLGDVTGLDGLIESAQTKQEVSVLSRTGEPNAFSQSDEQAMQNSAETNESELEPRYQKGKLVPYGYELFAGSPSTFSPLNDIPVSADYMLGPGDVLQIDLFGKEGESLELGIDATGKVYFPNLGPVSLAGLTFQEAKQKITEMVKQKMIGVKASVSMLELKAIRVFVLGEAYVPGSYVVSSLSTITNALVLSGGIAETGSLRNIQLKRQGKRVQTLDLYSLLLEGDTSKDVTLRSGDVVFIPPVGDTVGIDGEVRRPAIYEFAKGETLGDILGFAGGLLSSAFPAEAMLERIGDNDQKTVIDLNAVPKTLEKTAAQTGDVLKIPSVLAKTENTVALRGHVYRPGVRNWSKGLRLLDVVKSVDQLKPRADLRYGLIKRYVPPQKTLEMLSFNLAEALAKPGSDENVVLQSQDEILIFGLYPSDQGVLPGSEIVEMPVETAIPLLGQRQPGVDMNDAAFLLPSVSEADAPQELIDRDRSHSRTQVTVSVYEEEGAYWGRQWVIDEILQELRAQSEIGRPSPEVKITGSVRYPGDFPLVEGMGVEELIYAAGGLTEKAYKLSAEISRTGFNDRQVRNQERFEIDLNTELALDFKFQSRDVLQIRSIPEWVENHYVTLTGEVRFPGQYPIHKDDTLRDVLDRAGGVTDYAYVPGSLFTRVELQKQQADRLADMQRRLAEDIAKAQLLDKDGRAQSADLGTAQELLFQLQHTPAVGRLVIDLAKVIKEDPDYLIPLQHGDTLNVPARKNSVTIIGEVQLPISQVFEPALEYNDYIDRSGGITDKADEERIYVIKANGGVQSPGSSNWFSSNDSNIDPGDTIVVPLDADKLDQLVLWRDVSQIFYQIALGAAAVGSL